MPLKCCVPGCKSNYYYKSEATSHIRVFKFPEEESARCKWLKCIPRKDWTPTKNSVVCIKHFHECDISRVEKYKNANGEWKEFPRNTPILIPGAIPRIFPGLPKIQALHKFGLSKLQEDEEVDVRGIKTEDPFDEIEIDDSAYRALKKEALDYINGVKIEQSEDVKPESTEFPVSVAVPQNTGPGPSLDSADDPASIGCSNIDENCLDSSGQFPFEHVVVKPENNASDYEEENLCRTDCHSDPLAEDPLEIGTNNEVAKILFNCKICNKVFHQISHLDSHLLTHFGKKPFSCTVCERRFTQPSALKCHLLTHTGEQPFSCTVCTKRFSNKSSMKTHMFSHTGEKPFSCKVCKRRFSLQCNMKNHMLTHTGEQPFSCTVCKKRFSCKSSVKNHMFSHTGEKPFSCKVCKRRFTLQCNVKNHMLTHTGEQPFSCTVCTKRFSRKFDMNKHMLTHTGEKPFPCTVCTKRFTNSVKLKLHLLKH